MPREMFWRKQFSIAEVNFVLDQVKESRRIDDVGSVSFLGFGSLDSKIAILVSAIAIDLETGAAKESIVRRTLFSKRLSEKFSEADFRAEIYRVRNEHLNGESKFFRVAFPIWNKPKFLSGKVRVDGATLDFTPSISSSINKRIFKERLEQRSDSHFKHIFTPENLEDLRKCETCIVRVKASTPADANERASNAVYEILGIANFIRDTGKSWRILSRSRGSLPVSDVLIGPHTTVHFDKGKIAYQGFWHENWTGGPHLNGITDEYLKAWEKRYLQIRQAIQRSKWRGTCKKAIVKHYKAFSNPNLEDSFLEGWKLFELITGSQFETSETQINRAASVFQNSMEMRIVGKHLAFRRNAVAHGHDIHVDDHEALAFQMVSFVSPLMERFILNGFSFKRVEDFWEFLDLPIAKGERDAERRENIRRLGILKKAAKFRREV